MSRTLINHIPIHPMQYPEQGQNYVFNGCMKFLMECVGEKNQEYDYWFFSAVSGDCFVQVFHTNKEKWATCLSHVKFDRELMQRVSDAIGYGFTLVEPQEWKKDPEALRAKIMDSIDRGVPVIGKGFYSNFCNKTMPVSSVRAVIGYEDGGDRFYRLTEESTELIPFRLEDGLPYSFVFLEEKKKAPPVAQAYREALRAAPELMRTQPCDGGEVFFGSDAFEQWARMLEGGFYRMTREEYEESNAIASWRYYCVYVCNLATNIYSKRHTIDRAIRLNPDLAPLAPLLAREYQALDGLEQELQAAGGGFNVTYETLQNPDRCREIARILRKFPPVFDRICSLLEHWAKP